MAYLKKLSALNPSVVDVLYTMDRAVPQAEPVFLFLVGAPGSGKSSSHERAVHAGLLPPDHYATINMDILLESLLPFRAASSMAHFFKQEEIPIRFSTINAYRSRQEDLGLFKWYDSLDSSHKIFDDIRDLFQPLEGREAPHTLLEINDAALTRAIDRQIPIVYETTLQLSKEGRVTKVDNLMHYLKRTPYRIVFYHIRSDPISLAARLHHRQEHGTTQGPYPFHRYVPSSPEKVTEYIRHTQTAFDVLKRHYKKAAIFEEFVNPLDTHRLSSENRRSSSTRKRHILRAYSDPRSSDLYMSTPSPSSDTLTLSSPSDH